MGKFNLGEFLNNEIFNKSEFKQFTGTIGNIGGKFLNFGETMMNNMLKLSTNVSNFMGTSYFPIFILGIGGLIILWKKSNIKINIKN